MVRNAPLPTARSVGKIGTQPDASLRFYCVMTPDPLRVFIVENHADTVRYLSRYFEQLGHSVDTAADLSTALQRFKPTDCDLLISDIGLPDGDGWELLRRLGGARDFFAVAMSGCGAHADKARSREVGFRHHLLKPFYPEEFDRIIVEAHEFRRKKLGGN